MSPYDFPYEIRSDICVAIYESFQTKPALTSLDPLVLNSTPAPTALPSSYPPCRWSEPSARTTLKNLCLVSKAWYQAAKPLLWRNIEIRLPITWLSFVEEVALPEDETEADAIVDNSLMQAATALISASHSPDDKGISSLVQQTILFELAGLPHSSIPPELLSPPASRDPSPARLRARSPGRWRFMRAVSDAAQRAAPYVYVPVPEDPRPGRHVHHLDFNHFRTIGMRRSVGEGVNNRFVTPSRVERVLKEMPNLTRFGATEYMDSALTKGVLEELFLRGNALVSRSDGRGRDNRTRGTPDVSSPLSNAVESDDSERRKECKDIEAFDFCGCVSSVFVQALESFVHEYLEPSVDIDGFVTYSDMVFSGIKRLGLRGVTSVPSSILTPFVLACTSLTHLDLSGTRCGPELLNNLADSSTTKLVALSLGRCPRLTGEAIVDFLVDGLPARTLVELSLFGDASFSAPLDAEQLQKIITKAPCFTNGTLRYLDLSSCALTPDLLDQFTPQPALRSFGLSYILDLPLRSVSNFLLQKAPNVEVLTLVHTSPELGVTIPWRQLSMNLHMMIIAPLATPPFRFSLSANPDPVDPPTRLRVIELDPGTLNRLGAGADAWRVVRSKGGRGWYVHGGSGWINGTLRRDLKPDHPMRNEIERLAASNGNVSSGVGWHSRKLEVLRGEGFLGREDGLYGAVAFAYQG